MAVHPKVHSITLGDLLGIKAWLIYLIQEAGGEREIIAISQRF